MIKKSCEGIASGFGQITGIEFDTGFFYPNGEFHMKAQFAFHSYSIPVRGLARKSVLALLVAATFAATGLTTRSDALEKSDCKIGDERAACGGPGPGDLQPLDIPRDRDERATKLAEVQQAKRELERQKAEERRKREAERAKREAEIANREVVKSLGRIKSLDPTKPIGQAGPSGPKMSICEHAASARARNSPAAPTLEAQCKASRP